MTANDGPRSSLTQVRGQNDRQHSVSAFQLKAAPLLS